jgi:hypothetical protein
MTHSKKKKWEWDASTPSRQGRWQWYDGGKREAPLSGAERARRLKKARPKAERAIVKAVEVARRLQKGLKRPSPQKAQKGKCKQSFKAGQKVLYATVDKPRLRLQGKLVRLWESARPSLYGSCFWIVERCRRDLTEDKRLGKYVAVVPHNVFPL